MNIKTSMRAYRTPARCKKHTWPNKTPLYKVFFQHPQKAPARIRPPLLPYGVGVCREMLASSVGERLRKCMSPLLYRCGAGARTRANDKGSKRPPWIGATYAELATEARRLTSGVFRRRCGSGHKQRAQAPSQAGALSVVSSRGDDGAARGTDGQHL